MKSSIKIDVDSGGSYLPFIDIWCEPSWGRFGDLRDKALSLFLEKAEKDGIILVTGARSTDGPQQWIIQINPDPDKHIHPIDAAEAGSVEEVRRNFGLKD